VGGAWQRQHSRLHAGGNSRARHALHDTTAAHAHAPCDNRMLIAAGRLRTLRSLPLPAAIVAADPGALGRACATTGAAGAAAGAETAGAAGGAICMGGGGIMPIQGAAAYMGG